MCLTSHWLSKVTTYYAGIHLLKPIIVETFGALVLKFIFNQIVFIFIHADVLVARSLLVYRRG